jgi:hypothetical protein
MRVVLDFLRERIRQPGKAARVHADIQVASLGIGRADVVWIRVTFDPLLIGTGAFGRAVLWRPPALLTLPSIGPHDGAITLRQA